MVGQGRGEGSESGRVDRDIGYLCRCSMRSLLTVSFYIARVNRCIHQCSALAHSLARASAGLRTQSITPAQLPFPTPTSASGLQALAPADDAELRTAQLDASVSSKANLHVSVMQVEKVLNASVLDYLYNSALAFVPSTICSPSTTASYRRMLPHLLCSGSFTACSESSRKGRSK
ncbi:uncharacterized protein C8Q71DRAFT_729009 [Rhodofomes roseus]|uniref:Uncharacterized protein n=1 Tax=Rhodofomes roseus TaxID=34475 RepID=A0ABQ8KWX6_9APHY|nr:uncharacterized protein C8Q71DRAFT_728993 [Rhodofomes roseus]XP_047784376.1 uncharacterized protein C8Q71DRAFT_729009 [Rhodofomes roseus]KAH9843564.1 hypothetical protein C8Q71DRAFT_728993 [Rhodofomes roseus]KAH9843566.1 hypothetical protein C8Q71DRAFT_729009 [Rhodofomes roseus]